MSPNLPTRLQHVFWIGGGSGAGKSTVARRLASEHDLLFVDTDEAMADHARRSDPLECPLLHEFLKMDMDERWVQRSPTDMLDTFPWFDGEGFDLIVEELLEIPHSERVVVEGFRLLPGLVAPLLARAAAAVWLLPSPSFRQLAFERRDSTDAILDRTSNPDRALKNLLKRDEMFTERLRTETQRHGLATIDVDDTWTESQLVRQTAALLGLARKDR